jgi:hypothetical protein
LPRCTTSTFTLPRARFLPGPDSTSYAAHALLSLQLLHLSHSLHALKLLHDGEHRLFQFSLLQRTVAILVEGLDHLLRHLRGIEVGTLQPTLLAWKTVAVSRGYATALRSTLPLTLRFAFTLSIRIASDHTGKKQRAAKYPCESLHHFPLSCRSGFKVLYLLEDESTATGVEMSLASMIRSHDRTVSLLKAYQCSLEKQRDL